MTAPTVTSYKRLVVGAPTSGSTWAPVYISYGYNNRTQMLRIPAAGRIEDRTRRRLLQPVPGRDRDARRRPRRDRARLDPGEPTTDLNLHELDEAERAELGIEVLPANLLDATRELERDDVLRAALGTAPTRTTSTTSSRVKRREWQQAHEQITQWELDRYLQLF